MKEFIQHTEDSVLNHRIGRPDRKKVIQQDEIINLVIALEINEDVLDVLDDKYLFGT